MTLFSQNLEDNQPKVGLVLSGGGAKGLAHIGALQVIDSLDIKVDYIGGTSMGAIVGSLYASGYSGKQLDSIFHNLDFEKLINDDIPRASKTFYERENAEKYAITLPFNNFKIQLPSAISRGQNVFNFLSKLTLHVSDVEDFKDLPIPFFCIATNMETGEQTILDKGSLPQAISASGSLPSLFQPVYIGDKVYTDGGVVNNYPVDELRAKGMDIIIGVDVQDGLLSIEELQSAPDILLQINNFRTIKAMKDKSNKTEIYIKPDIKEFNVVSFDKGSTIIKRGKNAAYQKINALLDLTQKQKFKEKSQIQFKDLDSITISKVEITGNKRYTRSYILGKLKLIAGETISYKTFNQGINNLVATNNFESFLYRFKPDTEGYILQAEVRESKNTTYFKVGMHYDDLYKSAALLNLTQKRLLLNNDVASFDLALGDNIRYNFEYFIDKGFYWSVGLKSRFNTFNKSVNSSLILPEEELEITGLNKIDAEIEDFTNQFFLQTLFRRDFRLRAGIQHKRLKITSETFNESETEDEFTFEKSDFFSVFSQLKFDTFDNKYFPNKGFIFDGEFQLYFSSTDYNNNFSEISYAKADLGYAMSFSDRFSVLLDSKGGFKIGEDTNNSLNYAIGGWGNNLINNFVEFYGYDFISLTGNSFVKGSIHFDYELIKKHHISLTANYANVGDNIFENGEWFTEPDYSGYALGYGLESFIGPVEVKYTWSPETKKSIWFFSLGYWF
ncbi:MAG: patatin [Flavobacteriaceae bacterium]|nr:patatin [Flavobacteriaceae bacterium]